MNTLTLVTKTGIVNHFEIEGINEKKTNNLVQIIHRDILSYKIINLNPHQDCDLIKSPTVSENISKYQSVLLNGIQLVKNGRLASTPFWKIWRKF